MPQHRMITVSNDFQEVVGRAPLRVGVLLNTLKVPAWVAAILEEIERGSFARIELVAVNDTQPQRRSAMQKLALNRTRLLYAAYRSVDERTARCTPDAFRPTDVTPLLTRATIISISPRRTRFSDYFPDAAIRQIVDADLDVILRFGFRILRGPILQTARYGVWSYHHGDNQVHRGGPSGFWEVFEGDAVTGAVLQVLSDDLDGGTVLARSYVRTNRWSVHRSRNNQYLKSVALAVRALKTLHRQGPGVMSCASGTNGFDPYSRPLYRVPGNRVMTRLLARKSAELVGHQARKLLGRPQWFIAFKTHAGDAPDTTFYRFRPLLPPADRFWADPFPIARNGRHYIFFEEFIRRNGRGHIAVMEINADGTVGAPRVVLERPYHLAYPHIFEWRGELFMVPDSSQARGVQLFRCTRFPGEWTLETVLLEDIPATDATLQQIDGVWWLFTTIADPPAENYETLHLFHAETPMGPWIPHQANPVKIDVRSARPAGRLFEHGAHWYRPAQDCSIRYGYGIQVNRIERLDRHDYREQVTATIGPGWYPGLVGTHTLNHCPGMTVIDGRRRMHRRWV